MLHLKKTMVALSFSTIFSLMATTQTVDSGSTQCPGNSLSGQQPFVMNSSQCGPSTPTQTTPQFTCGDVGPTHSFAPDSFHTENPSPIFGESSGWAGWNPGPFF